jgi:hypothetical protein
MTEDIIASVWTPEECLAQIPAVQVAVYVMAGGGIRGLLAAEQPAEFHTDNTRMPYSKRRVFSAVGTLVRLAEKAGLDPHRLPPMPRFHNLGVF